MATASTSSIAVCITSVQDAADAWRIAQSCFAPHNTGQAIELVFIVDKPDIIADFDRNYNQHAAKIVTDNHKLAFYSYDQLQSDSLAIADITSNETVLISDETPEVIPFIIENTLHANLNKDAINAVVLLEQEYDDELKRRRVSQWHRKGVRKQVSHIRAQLRSSRRFRHPLARSFVLPRQLLADHGSGLLHSNLAQLGQRVSPGMVTEIPLLLPEQYQKQYEQVSDHAYIKSEPRNTDRFAWLKNNNRPEPKPIRINIFLLLSALAVLLYAGITAPTTSIIALLTMSGIILFFQASVELYRMVFAVRDPDAIDQLSFPEITANAPKQEFCLLVPARHEASVIASTLQQLTKQTYSGVSIYAVICSDDVETHDAAQTIAERHESVQIIVYPLQEDEKPSKPKQLNYAFGQLKNAGYDVFGIIDAEDTVHPELIGKVNAAFASEQADIVQGGVQLMNHDSSWYSLHNVLEYYRWFNSGLTFHSKIGFIPLGGNTVFVTQELLVATDGWPQTLTEDCSLGVLVSTRSDAKVSVHYEPALATQEETPSSIKDLFKQRVRWSQGFFHEWRKNIWSELPSFKQRLLADYVLIGPVLMAIVSIVLILSLIAVFTVDAPVALVMIMYVPLIPSILMIAVNCMYLYDFGKAFDRSVKVHHYIILITTQIFYQTILNAAAFWAVIRELRGNQTWDKTAHKGLHRSGQSSIDHVAAASTLEASS